MPSRYSEVMRIRDLVPAERNAKDHAADLIAASVDRFGVIEPIVLDERTGRIISGHGRRARYLEAEAAGAEPPDGIEVDADGVWTTAVMRGWSSNDDAEADAAAVVINRAGEVGGWKVDVLADILDTISGTPSGFTGVGYVATDLDDLRAQQDEAPPPPDFVSFTDEIHAGEAAHTENGFGDLLSSFRNKQVRSMVFDYPLADYQEVAELAARARPSFGVESNAELFALMLKEWAKEHAPA